MSSRCINYTIPVCIIVGAWLHRPVWQLPKKNLSSAQVSQVQPALPHNSNVREVNGKCTRCRVMPELDETFPFQNMSPLNSAWYQLQEGLQWSSLLSLVSQTRCSFWWCYLWARLQFIHRLMGHHLVQTSLQTFSGFTPNYRCKVPHCESEDVSSLTYYQHEASDNLNYALTFELVSFGHWAYQ